MPLLYNALVPAAALNLDTLVSGTITGGAALLMGDNARQKVRNLSALVVADCETNTMTMTGVWQVSNDNSTWVTVTNGPQNAAGVLFATGTAGADATVTKCFQAPDAVYGWRWSRFAIQNLVTTGAATDTYLIGYNYRSGA